MSSAELRTTGFLRQPGAHFTAIGVVVGDVATAVGVAAFGFVVGPFVYYGHGKAWDYFSGGARVTV